MAENGFITGRELLETLEDMDDESLEYPITISVFDHDDKAVSILPLRAICRGEIKSLKGDEVQGTITFETFSTEKRLLKYRDESEGSIG